LPITQIASSVSVVLLQSNYVGYKYITVEYYTHHAHDVVPSPKLEMKDPSPSHDLRSTACETSSVVLSSQASNSFSLNDLDEHVHDDVHGIELLREIFPEMTFMELRQLHKGRLAQVKEDASAELPVSVAVNDMAAQKCETIDDLERNVIERLGLTASSQANLKSVIVSHDSDGSLGVNLQEQRGRIYVHSFSCPNTPAEASGMKRGDVLIGVNGEVIIQAPGGELLLNAGRMLRESPDPVVIHLSRKVLRPPFIVTMQSLLDATDIQDEELTVGPNSMASYVSTPTTCMSAHQIHPLVACLASKGIIKSKLAQEESNKDLLSITERALMWETTGCLAGSFVGATVHDSVSVMRIRKALNIRLVNHFFSNGSAAYAICVHDTESSCEFYAPIRYKEDFEDLRKVAIRLIPKPSSLSFQGVRTNMFGSPRNATEEDLEKRRQSLEEFLSCLATQIYFATVDAHVVEVSLHLQSFLGCQDSRRDHDTERRSCSAFEQLDKSIQICVFRLFLLKPMRNFVETFVRSMRRKMYRVREEIERLEAFDRAALKGRALAELSSVQVFVDQLQEIILVTCEQDFRSVASREEFDSCIDSKLSFAVREEQMTKLIRRAVREQIEINVYVPLREYLSAWLVHGYKDEDAKIRLKMAQLQNHHSSYFSDMLGDEEVWDPVVKVLRDGVERSTLPCIKVQAILRAASVLNDIYDEQRRSSRHDIVSRMGADEFLNIFILCVVRSGMERPCALCALLQTLSDPINRMGETGYYLASFEASVAYLQGLDTTSDRPMSPPSTENSLISVSLDG